MSFKQSADVMGLVEAILFAFLPESDAPRISIRVYLGLKVIM